MNKLIFVAAALGFSLAFGACTITGDPGSSGTPCEAITCQDALTAGLSTQGDDLCDSAASSAYNTLLDCACLSGGGQGLCDMECGGTLCVDLGEDSACGDCLNANCAPEHNTCGNN